MTVSKLISKDLKSTIMEWVDEIRNSEFVITNEMMFDSFKYSGISSSFDGSEDDMFLGYVDLEKGSETIEIENEEGSDQEDEYIISSSSSDSYKLNFF